MTIVRRVSTPILYEQRLNNLKIFESSCSANLFGCSCCLQQGGGGVGVERGGVAAQSVKLTTPGKEGLMETPQF